MNRLLVISQAKMGLLGINEDFILGFALMASHMQVPSKNGEENSFKKGEKEYSKASLFMEFSRQEYLSE